MTIRNNSFYTYVEGPTWDEAETNAIALGGHLVTIDDSSENQWLVDNLAGQNYYYLDTYGSDYFRDAYWIGFTLSGTTFSWADGTAWDYSNFGTGEPAYNGNYGEITLRAKYSGWASTAGKWNDETAGNPHYGIAEIPLSYFSISDLTITEGESGDVTISRTGGINTAQNLTLTSSSGSATEGSDYSSISRQTISFAAGETSKTISISSIEDTTAEGDETFSLTIAASGTDDIPPQLSNGGSSMGATVTISDDDGIINGTSWYKYVSGPTWNDAEANAVLLGGHLVTINDATENDWVFSNFGDGSWIGFTDQISEGDWKWISGEEVTYTNWYSGQPSNSIHPSNGTDQDYAWMHTDFLGKWDDHFGSNDVGPSANSGIAEVPLSYFSISDLTIAEGESGNVTISRTGGTSTVQNLTLTSSNGSATAGVDYSSISQTISFAAGETSKTISISSIEDTTSETNETYSLSIEGSSNDSVPAQFIDAISLITINDDDGIVNGTSFYKLVDGPTWSEAEANALNLGGNLITINNSVENDWVMNNISKDSGKTGFWIGLNDINQEGSWSWTNGESVGYTNWQTGEPNNTSGDDGGDEDAAFIITWGEYWGNPGYTDGKWNDGDINDSRIANQLRGIAEVPLSYFSISDLTITEGESGNVTISRTGGTSTVQNLTLTSSNGSATAGVDYSSISQTISFAAGETSKTISISSIEDTTAEGDETFSLTIAASNSDNVPAQIIDGNASVIITDDDTNNDSTAPIITGPSNHQTSGNGVGLSSATPSINENTSFVHTFTANETVKWDFDDSALYGTGGSDVSQFTIDSNTGVLNFKVSPDFESPNDSDINNDYVVVVRATDTAGNISLQPLTVTIKDVQEKPFKIKGPSGDPGDNSSSKAIQENATSIYTFTANEFVTWSLSGGVDKDLFSIDSSTGALTFNSAPDYESPSDSNKDNSYVVDVRATDSLNNYVDQTVSVLIADVDELTSSPIYSIYTDINVPQENYLLTTTAQTSNVAAGTKLYWSLSGTYINLADFSSGTMNGEGTVGSDGSFSFQHLLANDGLTEGYETIDIKLFSDNSLSTQLGITKSILIRDSAITEQIAELDTQLNTIKSLLTVGQEYSLSNIRDYDGNLHATTSTVSTTVSSSYKYQGLLDVNKDGTKEAIYTNKESGRWVTASVDSTTGLTDYSDYGKDGTTRIVGIYIDPLVQSGEVIKDSDFDSQRRFQNDLEIDNLLAKTAGDFDGDGFQEVYWKTTDDTAYLRALMHDDGNIQYANYQSESQMTEYLTANGFSSTVAEIIS